MGEISAELKKFKSSVEPQIGNMNSTCSNIISKVNEISSKTQTIKSGVDNYYDSSNKSTILGKFDEIGQIYSSISSSVSSELKGMINSADALVGKIGELENINTQIAELTNKMNSIKGSSDTEKYKRSNYQSQIASLEKQFDEKHEKAKSDLTALKGKDSSISLPSSSSSGDTKPVEVKDLKYGEVNYLKFTAKNGKTIETYVYVPKNPENIKLPVLLYMHGDSAGNLPATTALKQGLPRMIDKKEITPQGIVIMPYICGHDQKGTTEALKELTDEVVKKCNGDKNRIALSGHSHGGILAYKMINEYPNTFSCCVPISGSGPVSEAFKGMKVWSFNSVNEGNNASLVTYNAGVNAVKRVNAAGGKAKLTQLRKRHRYTNDETFEKKYLSPDGKEESVLDWIFRQTRA